MIKFCRTRHQDADLNIKKTDETGLADSVNNSLRRRMDAIRRDIRELRYLHDVMHDALSEIVRLPSPDSIECPMGDYELNVKRLAATALAQVEISERRLS